jgi:hypothetical protein
MVRDVSTLTDKQKVKEENVLRKFIATTEKISIKPKEVDFWCPVNIEDGSDAQKL